MKVLCLLGTTVRPGDQWLWDSIPGHHDQVDFQWVQPRDAFPKWGKLLAYYPTFMWLGLRAAARTSHRQYDVVAAWEGACGIPLALIRSLLRWRRPPLVILGYNQRGVIRHFPALTRFALRSVDRLVVLSEWEANHLSERLGIARDKVTFCAHGWYDVGAIQGHLPHPAHPFIFACGRSHRDYATFAAALDGLPVHAVINAQPFSVKGITFPPQVTINGLLPVTQFWTLLAQSRFVVVPLLDIPHSGGDSVILQAMAAGRAVVATRAPSPLTYVDDGETGLLVPPGDVDALRTAMRYLWEHPEDAARMGRNARQRYEKQHTFEAFACRVHAILRAVVAQAQSQPRATDA